MYNRKNNKNLEIIEKKIMDVIEMMGIRTLMVYTISFKYKGP